MHKELKGILLLTLLSSTIISATYPPESPLKFRSMPAAVPTPGYLAPYQDPTFGSIVTRVADREAMGSTKDVIGHHYAKAQPWNADGSLIMLSGWPSAILDGKTYEFLRWVMPQGEHHTWSNLDPRIIYGIQQPNSWVEVDAVNGQATTIRTFTEYTTVSYGGWEGNLSNDDHYVVLQCKTPTDNWVVLYDLPNDEVVSRMNIGAIWPNNVTMSQSGRFVAVQWDIAGSGDRQGIDIFTRDMEFVRKVGTCQGCHYDLGYDIEGHEVAVMTDIDGSSRAIVAIRLDSGRKTILLKDSQMSWYIHVSCRNVDRPGWAYLTEFADKNTQVRKPNYQLAFAVKIDGSGMVEHFAHVHHSATIAYDRSPFGVPSRDGSKIMFRSDWEDGGGPVYSYVAQMPAEVETSIDEEMGQVIPDRLHLNPVFPNPFNLSTTISFALNEPDRVTVDVYDILGQKVDTLVNGFLEMGNHSMTWSANNFSTGTYFCAIQAGEYAESRKMILLK